MHASDVAWVFSDLEQAGVLTSVQLERLVATGRNARGRRLETPTPVGEPFGAYLTGRRDTLARAGFGEHASVQLAAVCPPCSDVQVDDQLVAIDGRRVGQRFRVVAVPEGEGAIAPVLAGLERMRGDA